MMTNGDKLRSMTNEEIANIVEFVDCCNDYFECPYLRDKQACTEHSCHNGFIAWLKHEVNENESEVETDKRGNGNWIEIEHYEFYGTDFAPHSDYKCSACGHVITKPTGCEPTFCEDCGMQMLTFAKDTNVRTKTRDLTDEEAAVYDQWLNYDAKDTGEKLW